MALDLLLFIWVYLCGKPRNVCMINVIDSFICFINIISFQVWLWEILYRKITFKAVYQNPTISSNLKFNILSRRFVLDLYYEQAIWKWNSGWLLSDKGVNTFVSMICMFGICCFATEVQNGIFIGYKVVRGLFS